MQHSDSLTARSVVSGTVAAMVMTLAASLAGKRETDSYAAPLNATSHILWGDQAARHDETSLKYTLTGFLLNHGAAIFWAALYEKWFAGSARRAAQGSSAMGGQSALRPLVGAALVTAGAYITDYHLVPRRFTPGFEMRLSGRSLALIYGTLALGLAATTIMRQGRNSAAAN